MVLASGKSVLVECVEERIRIEFFHCMNTLFSPLAGEEHQCAAHCGNACCIAYSLALYLLVALLVVTYVIDVISLILTVLFSREDAADIGLSVCSGTEACGVRQKSLKELDRNDLVALELNRCSRKHSDILETLHMSKIALAEGHEEADALNFGNVYCQ